MDMTKLNLGDRIVLDKMPDDPDPVPEGTHGTVIANATFHGSVRVHWDNDRRLTLVDVDEWHLLPLCPVCDDFVEDETEQYGCDHCDRDGIHEDCGRWFVVDKPTWNDPGWSDWACRTCITDDREYAEQQAAENRAEARAADRAYYDDLRY